jgi:Rad3-related DNA helicase
MSSPATPALAAPAEAHAAAESVQEAAAPAWTYTVSVRSLCEFTAKAGDLDRRFTPSATALEGIKGQLAVAARRGQDYESEVVLESSVGPLRVRGRADGYDPRRRCLEEVKTVRGHPDTIPANRRRLHWAQLETYGALFCRQRGVQEVTLALVTFDIETQTETELRQLCSAEELEQALIQRCDHFLAWARQEATHRAERDAGLVDLSFPPGTFRAGQRPLAEAVYRAATRGQCLLAQAPTGIGKTLGTLFPVLRAMPGQAIDKLAYLTCKGTGRDTALDALSALRDGTAGRGLRVLAMVSRAQACEHPDKACHGDACPLARGFYDRLAAARQDAVAVAWLDAPAQRRIALAHGICPYYLGQELVRWADVLVGDVHHAFDANGQLWGLMQALDWKLAVLVDEAHNLVERARQMYSAGLRLGAVQAAMQTAPAAVRGSLAGLIQAMEDLVADQEGAYAVMEAVPDAFVQALQAAAAALADHFQRQPLATGALLGFHFELQRFARLVDSLADHSLFDAQVGARPPMAMAATTVATVATVAMADSPGDLFDGTAETPPDAAPAGPRPPRQTAAADITLSVRNVVPARFLRPRFKAMHTATLFSATLGPPAYAIDLLGLPPDTGWIDVPPAFPAEHLTVRIAHGISTRFAHRARSLGAVVDLIAAQHDRHPGNYLAFFSSFEYLEQAAGLLARRRPDIAQWTQDRRIDAVARQAFLSRFVPDGRGVGFAVLGGVFAEGVDLPGSRLIGAFVATLGLPPVSPVQAQVRARLDRLCGPDSGYADLVPAMQKVVQAAGRILRTPEDRGTLWLLDDRYARDEVQRLLPVGWRLQRREVMSDG